MHLCPLPTNCRIVSRPDSLRLFEFVHCQSCRDLFRDDVLGRPWRKQPFSVATGGPCRPGRAPPPSSSLVHPSAAGRGPSPPCCCLLFGRTVRRRPEDPVLPPCGGRCPLSRPCSAPSPWRPRGRGAPPPLRPFPPGGWPPPALMARGWWPCDSSWPSMTWTATAPLVPSSPPPTLPPAPRRLSPPLAPSRRSRHPPPRHRHPLRRRRAGRWQAALPHRPRQ